MSTRMHHLARKYKTIPGGACPQTPLAVGAFHLLVSHSPPPSQNPGYGPAVPILLRSGNAEYFVLTVIGIG